MSIVGAHMLIYTPEAEKLREVFRDGLGFDHVDAGEGWLIFKLPPAEIGVHPSMSDGDTRHVLSLMCDDIEATTKHLSARGIHFVGEPAEEEWGTVTQMRLPGGVEMPLYEPRHPTAI